ncbi:hypothetical protein M422DRAFT_245885 [Sphaerobolus stellatus SS14]|nr:hypothetical protein M422DRAFT_245885 [Sphaerobolus stellatus SS14]
MAKALEELEQELLEEYRLESYIFGKKSPLTQDDLDNIEMLSLHLDNKITRIACEKFQRAFQDRICFDTFYLMHKRIMKLSGFVPNNFDCCINNCCLFAGEYKHLEECPFCHANCFNAFGKPQQYFDYLPIIPCLQGFFQSPDIIELLNYQMTRQVELGTLTDIFDGNHFQDLCRTLLLLEEEEYIYSSNPYDILLGLLSDGMCIFKCGPRSAPTVTPFIVQIYSFPPELRTHLDYLMLIGLVPGPKSPCDHNSFLVPFRDELLQLAHGVTTPNLLTE